MGRVFFQVLCLLLLVLFVACSSQTEVVKNSTINVPSDSSLQKTEKTALKPSVQKDSVANELIPLKIIQQYAEASSFPRLESILGVRLEMLKGQMTIGQMRQQNPQIEFTQTLYFQNERREAYRIELGGVDGKISAYWLFEKIGDQWIWTDLVQEAPYFPWLKFKMSFDPAAKLTAQDLYLGNNMVTNNSDPIESAPGFELYQHVRRGEGALEDLETYITSKREKYLAALDKLMEKNLYSAFLYTDSITKPERFEKWKDTGIYDFMNEEKLERVQIEGKGMVLFFYASRPNLEQGVIYCREFDVCQKLAPTIAGYYMIHYQQDPLDSKLQWIHYRGAAQ